MNEVERAIEQQMLQKADSFIDRMIPPEGASVLPGFGTYEDGNLDLIGSGSDAFAGMVDVDNPTDAFSGMVDANNPTDAFSGMVDVDNPTDAFGGMGALGRFGFNQFSRALRSLRGAKKRQARQRLRRVSRQHSRSLRRAKDFTRKAGRVSNLRQRTQLLNEAKRHERAAASLRRRARMFAAEAARPRISRAEARVAARPVVRQMAQKVAMATRREIARLGRAGRAPGGGVALRRLASSDLLKKGVRARLAADVAQANSPSSLPSVEGMGSGTSSYLALSDLGMDDMGIGNMDTVTQEPDAVDIVQSWNSDDIYGEPMGF